MSSPLKTIKSLIPYLPKGDIPFANRFLEKRDYDSLKELTSSALQRLENAMKKDVLPDKYKGVDIDKVRDLAVEVWEYYYLLYPEELEEQEDFNDGEED